VAKSKYLKLSEVPQLLGGGGNQRAAWWEDALATPPGCAYEIELNRRTINGVYATVHKSLKKYAPDGHLRVRQRRTRVFIVNEEPPDDH